MVCRAALVGQAVHQLCEHRRYTVAVHVGGAKEATRETGRASDGSDSYCYIWGVAACGSAISGEASCAEG
jgi:hypothetical protein